MRVCQRLFERAAFPLGIAAAFLMPLRLTLGYFPLIPLLFLWIGNFLSTRRSLLDYPGKIVRPFCLFLVTVALTSLFGINIHRSLSHIGSLIFFPLTVLLFHDIARQRGPLPFLLALSFGQAVSALNAVLETISPDLFPRVFSGMVTQSGQISLTLFAALGAITVLGQGALSYREAGIGLISFLFLTTTCFWRYLGLPEGAFPIVASVTAVSLITIISLPFITPARWKTREARIRLWLTSIALPLIAEALLVNLKRGPWAGILVGSLIFFSFYARKLVIPIVAVVVSLVVFVGPIRTRLLQSHDHFFIAGGRNVIWEIGGELAVKYPLGIGYENSGFLRNFSHEIPQELKHFHNNFLNILVEAGWLGLALYLWWIYLTLSNAFTSGMKKAYKPIAHAVGCAVISWQIAGLVEYNFGDSAVVSIAFMLVGILLAVSDSEQSAELPNSLHKGDIPLDARANFAHIAGQK